MGIELASTLALAGGAAWASGINLYAAMMMLGILGATGSMTLPPDLEVLAHPVVIAAAGLMYCVEFFADKTPGVDTGWDAIHTFIRIPAGAILAAGAVGDVEPAMQLAAFVVGGGLAAGTHAAKAGTRVMINASPEPVSNWGASLTEDLLVFGGLWAALNHPFVFVGFLVVFILLLVWLLPKLMRVVAALFRRIKRFISGDEAKDPERGDTPSAALNAPQPASKQASAGTT